MTGEFELHRNILDLLEDKKPRHTFEIAKKMRRPGSEVRRALRLLHRIQRVQNEGLVEVDNPATGKGVRTEVWSI